MQHNQSQTDSLKQKRTAEEQKQKELEENLKIACAEIFSTKNGKFFGKFLKNICKWDDTSETVDVNPQVLAYHKRGRDIWMILRVFIDKQDLADIEIYD